MGSRGGGGRGLEGSVCALLASQGEKMRAGLKCQGWKNLQVSCKCCLADTLNDQSLIGSLGLTVCPSTREEKSPEDGPHCKPFALLFRHFRHLSLLRELREVHKFPLCTSVKLAFQIHFCEERCEHASWCRVCKSHVDI